VSVTIDARAVSIGRELKAAQQAGAAAEREVQELKLRCTEAERSQVIYILLQPLLKCIREEL